MGLVARTNNPGMNASNILTKNQKKIQKSMEKLASGYKINHAADDASGLSISEKMREKITALDNSIESCEDGANYIQSADGYMAEVHDIVNRMVELAGKAANGVLDDEDRNDLQDEMDELSAEIDRIASTANFNGIKLLDGGGSEIVYDGFSVLVPVEGSLYIEPVKTAEDTASQLKGSVDAYLAGTCGGDYTKLQGNRVWYTADGTIEVSEKEPDSVKGKVRNSFPINIKSHEIEDPRMFQIGDTSTSADRLRVKVPNFHTDVLYSPKYDRIEAPSNNSTLTYVQANESGTNDIYTGNGGGSYTKILNGDFKKNTPTSTYSKAISVNISNQESAINNLDFIKGISSRISESRGLYGSYQNRLDHTINSGTLASENLSASMSRIKDTDMAKEMMNYTSQNVILQASQSMLAQANAHAQDVMSLLQQ